MCKFDDLVAEAMLHPKLARARRAKKATGAFSNSVIANAVRQIQAEGATAAANEAMRGEQK